MLKNELPKKAKNRIKRTKEVLKQYKCTFVEYMTDSCHRRGDVDLGEHVTMGDRRCIICGWNSSSNYDVYFFDTDEISNVHPSDIEKDKNV